MRSYLVLSRLTATPEEAGKHREAHHEYISKLNREGSIESGYRFTDRKGGFYILRAEDPAQADELASHDPYHFNKIREYSVIEVERTY
jgi:uncharacterized protein YciI